MFTYHIGLILHLVQCDFSLRYKQSALGVLWSLMLPLAQLMVLVFVFKHVVPLNIDAYPAFVFSALLPWTWFSACLSASGSLFLNNRNMVRKPNFAPLSLVFVNTISNLLNYLIVLPVLFVVLYLYKRPVTPALTIFPLLILIQGVLIAGIGLFVATLNVFYRDVQYIVNVALMLMFYLTPVFYGFQTANKYLHILYTMNPVAVLSMSHRTIFFYGKFPAFSSLLIAGVISVAVCGAGLLVYNRCLHDMIDTI